MMDEPPVLCFFKERNLERLKIEKEIANKVKWENNTTTNPTRDDDFGVDFTFYDIAPNPIELTFHKTMMT